MTSLDTGYLSPTRDMNQQQALTTDNYETLKMFGHTEHEEHDIENNMNKMDGLLSIIHFSGRRLN